MRFFTSHHSFIFLAVLFFGMSSLAKAQCPDDNVFWADATPPEKGTAVTTGCIFPTEYVTVNVQAGELYTFRSCNSPYNTILTLYNDGTGAYIDHNDDATAGPCAGTDDSFIMWTATFTGTVRVLLDEIGCPTSGSWTQCTNLVVTWRNGGSQTCGTPGFHAETQSQTPVSWPDPVSCDSAWFYLFPNDSSTSGGYITPALEFVFEPDGNAVADISEVTVYEDGTSIYNQTFQDNSLTTVYGDFLSPSSNYTFDLCETTGDGGVGYWVYDGTTGQLLGSGFMASGNPCETFGPFSPAGVTSWTGNGIFFSNDQGVAAFDPQTSGIGTHNLEYCFDNTASGGTCNVCADRNITVNNPYDASWSFNDSICEGDGTYDLSDSLDPSASSGGSWSGTGVSAGGVFDPSGLSGDYNITYSVGPTASCSASETHSIHVDPEDDPSFNYSPSTFCESDNDPAPTISGTTPGTFSGPAGVTFVNTSTGEVDLSASSAGTHTITYTTGGPCPNSSNQSITIYSDPSASITPAPAELCEGDTISMNGNPSGGSGSYASHSWTQDTGPLTSNSVVDPDFEPTSAGTYNLTYEVTDNNGCTGTDNIAVSVNPLPAFDTTSMTVTSSTCGNSDGSITGIVVNGSGGYTYSWENGSGTVVGSNLDLNGVPSGNYSLTVSDVNGCDSTLGPISVNDQSGPTLDASGVAVAEDTCSQSLGAISGITVSGGTSPYDFEWQDGVGATVGTSTSTSDIDSLPAGDYSLTVTDDNGCTDIVGPFTINNISGPSIDDNGVDIAEDTCTSQVGAITGIVVNGGTSPFTYTWKDASNSVVVSGSAATDLIDVGAGDYSLVVEDDNGCRDSSGAYTVNDFIGPSLDTSGLTVDSASCGGSDGNITGITVSNGTAPLTFEWTDGSGNLVGSSKDLNNISLGNYTLVVVDDHGCVDTVGPITLPEAGAPTIDDNGVTVDPDTCSNGLGAISGITVSGGTSPFDYYWVGGSGNPVDSSFTTADIDSLAAGNYSLIVEDNSNCSATSGPYNVSDLSGPSLDTSSVVTAPDTCSQNVGAVTGITVSGGNNPLSFEWKDSSGSVIGASLDITGVGAGSYALVVTDGYGCYDSVGVFSVNDLAGPDLDTSGMVIQPSTCGDTNGSITGVIVNGGAAPINLEWTDGSGSVVGASSDLTTVGAGNYSLKVTDANGCQDSLGPLPVSGNPGPVTDTAGVTEEPDTCGQGLGAISGVTVTGGSAPLVYEWYSGGTVLDSSTTNGGLDSLNAGNYYLVVTDSNNCKDTSEVLSVPDQPGPDVDASNVTISDDQCENGNGSVSGVSVSGGNAPLDRYWLDGAGDTVATGTSSIASLDSGSYSFYVTDAFGCRDSAGTFSVTSVPGPELDTQNVVTTDASCRRANGEIEGMDVQGGTTPYSFSWLNLSGDVVGDSLDFTDVGAGTYYIKVVDANGCQDSAGVYQVDNVGGPLADFSLSPAEGMIPLEVSFTDQSQGGTDFDWSFGDGDSANGKNPIHIYEERGEFNVTLTVVDSFGCQDTASGIVLVNAESTIEVPNVFTPNGDGKNDVFNINGEHMDEVDAVVFNRWGEKIYHWDSVLGGWDGTTSSGVEVPEGTYFYRIRAVGVDGETYDFKGTLSLFR